MSKSFDTFYTDFRLGGKRKNLFAGGSRSHGQDYGNANILSREPDWHDLDDVQLASAVHDYQLATAKTQAGVRQAHYNFAHATNQKTDFKALFNVLGSSERVGVAAGFQPGRESPHYAIPDFVYDRLGSKYRGGRHFNSFTMGGPKRKQSPYGVNTSRKASATEIKSAVVAAHSQIENVDQKRLPGSNYRLHVSKPINLPGFLGDLLMPTLRSTINFGFVSNNGVGTTMKGASDSGTNVASLAPKGQYRGIAMFKCRFTDALQNRSSEYCLNVAPHLLSTSSAGREVYSMYRRFSSNPKTANIGNCSQVVQTVPPSLTSSEVTASTVTGVNQLRRVGMGTNLTHMEDHAWQSTNFVQSVGKPATAQGNIGTTNVENVTDWNGSVPLLQGAGTTEDPYYYQSSVKDAIMRIKDGYVELDVSNTSKTGCVLELVIHAMKKTANDITDQTLINEIYNSYEYSVKGQEYGNVQSQNASPPGGWQTFYDPKVPFMHVPSKHRKTVDDIAREAHRSIHILAPGQTKLIKIALGGLYYKLGNKSLSLTTNVGNSGVVYSKRDNAGTLLFSLGHTGCDAFETLGSGDEVVNGIPGSGFWAGKSPSPSSIAVTGKYQEQYYPMYAYTTDREFANVGVHRGSYVVSSLQQHHGLPQNQLTTQHVTVSEDQEIGRPVGPAAIKSEPAA